MRMEKQPSSLRQKASSAARFDPFNNRLARDIRNALAEKFVDALLRADKSGYQRTADQWLAKNLDDEYSSYIQDLNMLLDN